MPKPSVQLLRRSRMGFYWLSSAFVVSPQIPTASPYLHLSCFRVSGLNQKKKSNRERKALYRLEVS